MQLDPKFLGTIFASSMAGIALGVLLAGGPSNAAIPSELGPETPPAKPAPPKPQAPQIGPRTVEKVISGDTVVLEKEGPVRLLGIDIQHGPDGKPPDQDVARVMLQQLAEGQQFVVECDPATAETEFKSEDGLQLVYLTRGDGLLVNTELILKGVAFADLGRDYSRRNELILAERDARWAGRGVWEIAANHQLSPLAPSTNLPSVTIPGSRLPQPGVPPATAPTLNKNDVLVTADGRFHHASCPLGKGGIPMTIEDARSKHYLACPKCFVSPKVSS